MASVEIKFGQDKIFKNYNSTSEILEDKNLMTYLGANANTLSISVNNVQYNGDLRDDDIVTLTTVQNTKG